MSGGTSSLRRHYPGQVRRVYSQPLFSLSSTPMNSVQKYATVLLIAISFASNRAATVSFHMKKIHTTILLALLLVTRMLTVQAQPYKPPVEKFTLGNGLGVVLHKDATLPLVTMQIAYRAGSSKDPSSRFGLAGIAGEMLLTGTARFPREKLLALQEAGNGTTSERTTVDWTTISSTFPMTQIETYLEVEADRLENAWASLSQSTLETIIRKRKNDVELAAKRPLGDVEATIYREIYPEGHPYRHMSAGDPAHLSKVTVTDVKKFMQGFIVPSNASLVIGGNFDPIAVRALVEKYFGFSSKPAAKTKSLPSLPALGQSVLIMEDELSSHKLFLIFPTVNATSPELPILNVISKLLTGSNSSRLVQLFTRDNSEGLSVSASQNSLEYDGNFWISITCKADTKLTDVYLRLMTALNNLSEAEIPDEEMAAARNLSEMEFLTAMEMCSGEGGRCDLLNLGNLFSQNPLFYFSQAETYSGISTTSVQQTFKKYFTSGNHLTLSIVPFGKKSFGVSL
jgi:zinc protease